MASMLKQKDIDFLSSYTKKERSPKSVPLWFKVGAAPVALLLVFGISAGGFAFDTARLNRQVRAAESYLNDISNKQQFTAAQKAAQELAALNTKITNLDGLTQLLATYPKFGKTIAQSILTACGGSITLTQMQYESSTGVLQLNASALSNKDAAQFIDRLRATKRFEDNITYYGFAGDNGSFTFSANCPLKVGAEQ